MSRHGFPTPPRNFLDGLRYCHNPLLVAHHFKAARQRRSFIAAITGAPEPEVKRVIDEIDSDEEFNAEILSRRQEYLGAAPHGTDFMYLVDEWGSQFFPFVLHYALVRLLKPAIVVETGGTPGSSSAFMLRAMQRNEQGRLVTLDLAALEMVGRLNTEAEANWYALMPKTLPPGWIVPEGLRVRQEQVLGDARETLPGVLEIYPEIDLFVHDSDHSYDHMTWEMTIAWPHLKPGGILLVDDIYLHNAFYDFADQMGLPTLELYHCFGVLKKPTS